MVDNKIALVTGASSGIGREIAIQLAKSNFDICINYSHSKEKADAVVSEICEFGGKALAFQADISDENSVKKMFEFIDSEFGALDVLINNAGVGHLRLMEDHDYESWKRVIDVNLSGKFLCTKYAVPLLKRSGNSKIVNIASRLASKAVERASAYGSAASAILMLTKVSALELSKYNISVNSVSPGLIRTSMTEKEWTKEDFALYAENNPSGRVGNVSDVANVVLFLVSDSADYINGENIDVNGGSLLK